MIEGANRYFYHYDAIGSVIALSNSAGAIVAAYSYSPWGETSEPASQAGKNNPFRFAGYRYEASVGLYHLRARDYSPLLGRFLQTDPIGTGDGMNVYAYVGNDPINMVDPSGLSRQAATQQGHASTAFSILKTVGEVAVGFIPGSGLVEAYQEARQGNIWTAAALGITELPGLKQAKGFYKAGRAIGNALAPAKRTSGTTVLGHYPAYKELADSQGHRRFDIPTQAWDKMDDAQRWAANQKFLDRTISRGDEIMLSTPLNTVRPGSYFARELEYLAGKGYRPNANSTHLVSK